MKTLHVNSEIMQEGRNIADGFYDPLEGFLNEDELSSVLETMRLPDGKIWPIPILIDINDDELSGLSDEIEIIITDGKSEIVLEDVTSYRFDKHHYAISLYGNCDINHPGFEKTFKMKDNILSGKIKSSTFSEKPHQHYLNPQDYRELFKKKGWKNIVAFQTRNPPHRSHEHLQKIAMGNVDGLLINPVIGPKKTGDFKDKYIIGSYEILIDKYFPDNSAVLGTFHTFMRYAGPKEAVFHALVRRNLGCTKMIIGRDHAGVGNYYGTYEAQDIFDRFEINELGIEILRYENVIYCRDCYDMAEENSCQHPIESKVHLSGTKLREKLLACEDIPIEFMRPEVAKYLIQNREDLFV